MEFSVSNNVDTYQTPINDFGLHCLPMTFYGFPSKDMVLAHNTKSCHDDYCAK